MRSSHSEGRLLRRLSVIFAVALSCGVAECLARDFLPSVTSRADKQRPVQPADFPSDQTLEQGGAVIGDIEFDVNDIFATDTANEDVTVFRLANFLHMKTKKSTIEQLVLFRVGEPFSRQRLEESERLLRQQNYIVDVHITPIKFQDGRVTIRVFTRDVWTLKPGVSFGRSGGTNTTGARIEESNLFGFGKQLSLDYGSNVDRTTTVLDYRDPQLFGSRWALGAQWGNNSDGRRNSLALERPFYSLDTRWSAGLKVLDERRIEPIYDQGNNIDEYRLQQRVATAYYGFSEGLKNNRATRWTAGVTHDERQFEAMPSRGGPGLIPASRKLVYPWISHSIAEDRFQVLENLNQIGRTEDLSLGWQTSTLLGYASKGFGSDRNALIWDSQLARNLAPAAGQIAELKAGLSGRAESSRLQNAKLSLSARYFIRDTPSRLTYLSVQTDVGRRLDADQPLTLGGDSGLRGYPLRYQAGSGRWLATIEHRYFSDWYPFRLFRVGGAIFFDAGRTWGDNPLGSRSIGTLQDIGFGLRIGHSRSGLGNVTHVNFAFPLNARGDIKKVQFIIETKSSF